MVPDGKQRVSFGDFPDDLLLEILSRLPVKSLVRFTSVNKACGMLGQNAIFNALQIEKSTMNGNNCLAVLRDHEFGGSFISFLSADIHCESHRVDLPLEITYQGLEMVDCCNGVFCLSTLQDFGFSNYLLNPATREFKSLPRVIHDVPGRPRTRNQCVSLGFGFDSLTNDYKLVRISSFFSDPNLGNVHSVISVYTLSTNSWRRTGIVDATVGTKVHKAAAALKGYLHWKAMKVDGDKSREFILSFDLGHEVLGSISLPDIHQDKKPRYWYPFTLNESLSLIVCYRDNVSKSFEIWVMNEYGIEETWTKRFALASSLKIKRLIGFGKNGTELVLANQDRQLVLFDPGSQRTQILKIRGVLVDQSEMLKYVETIVSIKGERFNVKILDRLWFWFYLCCFVVLIGWLVGLQFSEQRKVILI